MTPLTRPLVVCGPSGVGKGTLLKRLLSEFREEFALSVSHTTRAPREGETDGVNYHYTTREKLLEDVSLGKFIEHAEFAGNIYGTSIAAVREVQEAGKCCVLEIDVQGAQSVSKTDLNARYVFIHPPSFEVLVERLCGRGTETSEDTKQRLEAAKAELDFAKTSNLFEKHIINDDLEHAYAELLAYARQQ